MGMVDTDYDGHIFKLTKVFWAADLIAAEVKRLKGEKKRKKQPKEEEETAKQVDLSKRHQLSLRIATAKEGGNRAT